MNNIFSVLMTITPQIARDFLSKSAGNRRISHQRVDMFAKYILEDKWIIDNSGVAFDVNGNVIDAHHRLFGIVKADRPVQMMVTYNLPVEAKMTIDTGRARTLGDQLGVGGIKDPNVKAAVAGVILALESKNPVYDQRVVDKIAQYDLAANDTFFNSKITQKRYNKYRELLGNAKSIFAAHYLIDKHFPAQADTFFDVLETGMPILPQDETIINIRESLMRLKNNRHVIRNFVMAAGLIRAWDAWRQGKIIKRVNFLHTKERPIDWVDVKSLRKS
jgi:hypothetical protein